MELQTDGLQFIGLIRRVGLKKFKPIIFHGRNRVIGLAERLSYPIRVKISAKHPMHGLREYRLEPFIENQEFVGNRGDNPYWEGACSVLNTNGEEIGQAYLELAGYGGGLGARLN